MDGNLDRDIRFLKGVGERRAELFSKLGVNTARALLRYYPRSYIDLRGAYGVGEAPVGETCAVRARVYKKGAAIRVRGGKTLTKVSACDDTGELALVWFNNKFAPAALELEREYVFYGKLTGTLLEREMINPLVIKPEKAVGLEPRYPLTEGLSSGVVAACVKNALELCEDEIEETLPREIIDRHSLMPRREAIRTIHFPDSFEDAKRARNRLIFEELTALQLGLGLMKRKTREASAYKMADVDASPFIKSLPFELTGAQARSVGEVLKDMGSGAPMNRLLQGDVGSGKTAVAAAGVYVAHKNGCQSAVMAPTEILASQHAETFSRLLSRFGVNVGLLTSSVKGKVREGLLKAIADGQIDLVVGTHAILGESVKFKKLAFVVADEQHRFGVEQRAALLKKGERPHLLVMSATPIPRTLALIIYGDLDVSLIDELPPGRKPVKTYVVTDELRERYLGFVRNNAKQGRQSYIVCPLVDESEELPDALSAKEYKDELQNGPLKGLSVGLIHGRMKPADKAAVMAEFASGKTDVLVSTTVIEVGVDVPNATVMIIENADRYGLSTLHQLRGRIGRGDADSSCVLVSSGKGETAKARLDVMKSTTDGFEIARFDLKTRGPGDFFGKRQHGLPELAVADLAGDERIIYDAAEAVKYILEKDPGLEAPANAALKREVSDMFKANEGSLN